MKERGVEQFQVTLKSAECEQCVLPQVLVVGRGLCHRADWQQLVSSSLRKLVCAKHHGGCGRVGQDTEGLRQLMAAALGRLRGVAPLHAPWSCAIQCACVGPGPVFESAVY